jgi:hypothetical protein
MSNITVSTSRNLDDAVATALAGTISASTANTTVTGVGTTFNTTNTPLGAPLYSGTTFLGIINSITNTTTLLLRANSAATVTGVTGTVYRGLALENGDTITIDTGATLTINSDSRWGQQAAVLGITTISDGNLVVDGTTVWWVPFDASTGNVPSLGTQGTADVTVGGVNRGEFLGIFTDLAVSPSTAGTAMPATGYVKLRSKIGTINDNDVLTFANGATATVNSATGGQRGWLNIVGRDASTGVTVSGFSTTTWTGDWFELGTTNGNIGQQIKYYVADLCPALQIETSAGSGVYEWWQHVPTTQAPAGTITTTAGSAIVTGTGTTFNTTNTPVGSPLFTGDTIVGFVLSIQSTTQLTLTANALVVVTGAGSLRTSSPSFGLVAANFGTDARNNVYTSNPSTGTITFCGANAGRLPPSGAKIRVPNIHVSIAASANYAANIISAFPVYTMVITNNLNASTTMTHVNGQHRFAGGGKLFDIRFCGHTDGNGRTGSDGPNACEEVYYQDCVTCQHSSYGGSYAAHFWMQNCKKVTIKNCYMWGMFSEFAFNIRLSNNVTIDGGFFMRPQSNTWCAQLIGCTNVLVQDTKIGNHGGNFYNWLIDGCTGVTLKNWTFVGRNNTATQNVASVQIGIQNSSDILWDGYQFWIDAPNGNCSWSNCYDVRIRNIGTSGSPFTGGTNFRLTGFAPVLKRFSASKIYIANNGGDPLNIAPSDSYLLNSCYVTSGTGQFDTFTQVPGYARRGLGGTLRLSGVGGHFSEILNSYTAPTTIRLILACGSPKDPNDYRSEIAFTEDVGTFRRDGNSVAMVNLNDQITWTWSYYIKGVTSFANTAPTVNATNAANHTLTYDIDKGTGFSGTFKALTAANLSGETGISTSGVRLRIRAVCNTANINNRLNSIYVFANTDTASIAATSYGDNEAEYTITGSLADTRAAIFRNSDGALLYQASKTAPISLFCDWFSDTSATLRVRKPGYNTIESGFTLKELGGSIPVSQIDNAIPDTNPGSKSITITNHGASPVTWNSKQWSITITVTDGSSAATIANWLSWNQAQDSFSFDSTRHNMAYHDMVVAVGTSYETARGTVFGSAGAALKGVRVVDGGGNEIPGFARMQADDGTYYSPAVTSTITVGNLVSGDRVLVARDDGTGEILKDEYTPNAASLGATSITVAETIKAETPSSGVIRIKNARYTYSSVNTSTKTFSGLSPALIENIVSGDDVFVPFIDKITTSTSEAVTILFNTTFDCRVDVRNGGSTPILPFDSIISVVAPATTINASRVSDI